MILKNIAHLKVAKDGVRTASLTAIASEPAALDHATMIETWMDAVLALATDVEAATADHHTVQHIGVRLFNSSACAMDLILSGYYQGALHHIRDVLEIGFLLSDFGNEPSHIARWRDGTAADRKEFFKPFAVRTRIDKADGFTSKERARVYGMLSSYGGHATPEGVALLAKEDQLHAGPFFEPVRLSALLTELAIRLGPATLGFTHFFASYEGTAESHLALLEKTEKWRNNYLAPPK